MKTYIYRGAKDFCYHNVVIAKLGDTLEIKKEFIRNITDNNKSHKMPLEIVDDLLASCDEHDPESDLDIDELDLSDVKSLDITNLARLVKINLPVIEKLIHLGVLKTKDSSCRDYNVGMSNYSKHIIQPWTIWQEYGLNPWDADIIKRVLRTKQERGLSEEGQRVQDYQKIIHICEERIRQLSK